MAAIDFPSGAVAGQVFTTPNGAVYVYDGAKWVAQPSSNAFLPLSGGTLSGPLILNADPTAALGAATKQYSDQKLPLAGGTMTGPVNLKGVTDGSNAALGQVGEVITASASASMAASAAVNLTSITLTAGDWDVAASISYSASLSSSTYWLGWISAVSATFPGYNSQGVFAINPVAGAGIVQWTNTVAPVRYSVTGNTVIYACGQGGVAGTGWASLRARRVR